MATIQSHKKAKIHISAGVGKVMLIKRLLSQCSLFVFLLFASAGLTSAVAQDGSAGSVDTQPIELYFQLAHSIKTGGRPDDFLLKRYFKNAVVAFFNQRPGFDSAKFVQNLIRVYKGGVPYPAVPADEEYLSMLEYKKHEADVEKCIGYLKTVDIGAMVKNRLRPFYPLSINLDTLKLQYHYLFLDEGTGGLPGHVFNSALQTAYLPHQVIDVISAHEAYHTITSELFNKQYKRVFESASVSEIDKKLLWYLEIVAEEGIADLIDKPVLTSTKTPLAIQYERLSRNEFTRAQNKILLLDSLLTSDALSKGQNFNVNALMENGGHIPGRYMARMINSAHFEEYKQHTGNPFQFFYNYNSAAVQHNKSPPFSDSAMNKLRSMERQTGSQ